MNNYLQNKSEQNNLEDRIYNLEQNLERTNRLILDNLKAGVIKPDIYDPTLNETYS